MARTDKGSSPKTGNLELGRRIATRREELGMSRKELAEATALSYPYIAQIETGYRLPSTRHQVPLARALGLSLDELFGTEKELPQVFEHTMAAAAPAARSRGRRARPTIDEAIEQAARQIEALPASVRLEALSRIQLRIMQGVADEQARRQG